MGGGSGGGGEMEVDSEQVQVDVISSAKEAEKDFHVVLFYQYADVPEQTDKSKEVKVTADPSNLQELENWVQRKCTEHSLLGRVVLASEGINGNLASFGGSNVAKFCKELQALSIFKNHPIDFKMDSSSLKPFPDLHISIKREICSTGNTMPKSLLDSGLSGTHLSPEEFHGVLDEYWGKKKQDKELVVIDVRNDVEYKTGRFMGDEQGSEAVNPNTKTFSRWAPDYAKKVADDLKSKKVLMYCTGGIRCEKASAYLKSLGVEDVSQLSGGIHRYLEKFGSNGYFKGSNFVFDSRTLQTPDGAKVVGRCYACDGPSQEVTCDRCCAVCRQPVLVCDSCRVKLYGVYYCDVHTDMAGLYEPFLERFEIEELQAQKEGLLKLLKGKLKATTRRRPIGKQVKRIETWIERKKSQRQTEEATGKTVKKSKWGSNPRCRSCGMIGPDSLLSLMGRDFSDQSVLCDGNCVGFVRDSYENPRKTLDEMNDPAFCAPTKKRKRTQKTHREFAKRMRQETEKEYAETRYNIVAFPVNEDDLESNAMQMLRCVEPYYFQYQTHVKKRWWNRKLLEMYSSEFSGHETVHYQKAIEMGLIRVNGERSDPNRVLQNGDIITNWVHRHEPPVYYIPTQDMIVYDSPRLLVINKPASLTIHPSGSFRRNSVTFILAVEAGLHNLYPVHRLDRFTSGMVLIAKDPEYAKMIMEAMVRKTVGGDEAENADGQMVESRVQKAYLARVKGKFPSTQEEVVALQQTKKVFPKVRGSGESSTSGRSGCSSITGVEGEVYLDAVSIRPRGLYFEAADTEDPMLSLNLPIDPSKKSSASSNSHLVFSWPMQQVCQHTGTWRCYDPEVPLPAESTTVHNEDARPKSSMTRMRLIAYDPESDTSLVQCEPVTGRTHQLRVHLSYLGFPILNDPIYGENGDLFAGKTIRDEPDTSVVFEQLALPDDKQLEELADSEDMKALAKSFCVSCSLGMGMAFREVQMRRQGIDLHAYRYIVKLPDGSTEDHHTSMPFFSKPFVR